MVLPGACQSVLTTAYISLAAFSATSATLYGSSNSITYFASQTVKSTLAAQGTIKAAAMGPQSLGTEYRVAVGRSGDVLIHSYTLFNVPEVKLTASLVAGTTTYFSVGTITQIVPLLFTHAPTTGSCVTELPTTLIPMIGAKWVKRLGHQIFKDKCFNYGDLQANRYSPVYADFYLNFAIPVDKKYGYLTMIGDVPELTRDGLTWWLPLDAHGQQSLPSKLVIVPDLFYYEQDTGYGVPMAALPYQDININYHAQEIDQLLSIWVLTSAAGVGATVTNSCMRTYQPSQVPSIFVGGAVPKANDMATYLMYVLLSNDERKSMGCGVRDSLITQMQEQYVQGSSSDNTQANTQLQFSHDVNGLFMAMENTSNNVWDKSNYTNFPSYVTWGAGKLISISDSASQQVWIHCPGEDPAERFQVFYDNQCNVDAYSEISSNYYSYINANCSGSLPDAGGLNMYSYAYKNNFLLQPNGSVAYGRLSNVNLVTKYKPATTAVITSSSTLSDYGVTADLWNDVLPSFRCVIGKAKDAGSIAPVNDSTCGIAKQTFKCWTYARNWNATRVAGGAIGFPLL